MEDSQTAVPAAPAESTPLHRVWVGLCIAYPAVILLSIAATNVLLTLIVLGWIYLRPRLQAARARPILIIIALYLVWTLVTVALSPYSSNWHSWFEERSTFLALIPGLALGSNMAWLRRSFRYVSVILLLLGIYAVYQYFFGWDLLRAKPLAYLFHRYHAIGLQDFHLTFAGMIGLAMPLAAGLNSDSLLKSGSLALAGAVAVIAAMARTIMLGLTGGGVLFLLFGSRKLRWAGLVLVAALLILPSTIFTASGERLKRGMGVAQAPAEDQGDPTRIYLWKSALIIIQRYPWLGVGEGNWHAAFDKYGLPYKKYSTTAGAHNDFLDAMVRSGLVGGLLLIALWCCVIFYLSRSAWRTRGPERDIRLGLLVAFLVILFGGMFQGYQTDAENALLLWFLVGVGTKLSEPLIHADYTDSADLKKG